ncbi:hypothetical protein O7606_13575 [Micromonospora sp. WMMD882]|uniref:hypothetical protein n=1 Tax=Micromonospora sp. WMMD882 TaxID=3015151 RepID=UPI00248B9809|nr:hypothetical protein [Micromonospora sp. WMMD882]WBB77329.1 hypothetical protein O7606_13575 [Micromonospora sp. WMMD882]
MRRRVILLLGLPIVLAMTGCAQDGTTQAVDPENRWDSFHDRAARVVEAWQPGEVWKTGYVPLQAATMLIGDPKFTPETEQAFQAGWYRDQADLPTAVPKDGTIRFPDGPLAVPLVSAAEAYRQIDLGDPPPCPGRPKLPGPTIEPGADGPSPGAGGSTAGPDGSVSSTPGAVACVPLTVTGVQLGAAEIRTSRGLATVPAWLFTVDELAAPVARLAVAESAVDAVPAGDGPSAPPVPELAAAQNVISIDGADLKWRIGVGACDSGFEPLVAEFDDVVVIGGGVVRSTGVCTDQLVLKPVEATLKAPLGARAILDVVTGSPVSLLGE